MVKIFRDFFNSFKEKPDNWFFYAFLATSTLSIRKVLFFYPINNSFNEYTGIYFYLSDLFLFLTLLAWFFILCNKNIGLSILTVFSTLKNKCSTWNIYIDFTLKKTLLQPIKNGYQQVINKYYLFFPIFLVIFSFLSILWSNNKEIAAFRSFKLFELTLLFLYLWVKINTYRLPKNVNGEEKLFHPSTNVPRGTLYGAGVEHFSDELITFLKNCFIILIFSGFIQGIIGIMQFILQHSIGLIWLKESIISRYAPGVAKIILDGRLFIRSYGLFPHPNIFGGFLVFSTITSLLYLKLFHVEQFYRLKKFMKSFPIFYIKEVKIVPRGTILLLIGILVQSIALFLTFSKSAIIGLFIALLYLYFRNVSPRYKCSTWNIIRGGRGTFFHILKSNNFYKKSFLILSIVLLLFFILKPDKYSLLFKSLQERAFYLNVSRGTFLSNPILGIGSGQFVIDISNISSVQPWQFQPVHNVFLLVLNEFGIFVFFAFLIFLFDIYKNVPPQHKCSTPVQMFHVEHYTGRAWNILRGRRGTFLENNEATLDKTFSGSISDNETIITYFKAIFLSFTFIMLFDHYFWDIQQGQIILWIILGFIVGNRKTTI